MRKTIHFPQSRLFLLSMLTVVIVFCAWGVFLLRVKLHYSSLLCCCWGCLLFKMSLLTCLLQTVFVRRAGCYMNCDLVSNYYSLYGKLLLCSSFFLCFRCALNYDTKVSRTKLEAFSWHLKALVNIYFSLWLSCTTVTSSPPTDVPKDETMYDLFRIEVCSFFSVFYFSFIEWTFTHSQKVKDLNETQHMPSHL